MSLLDILRVYAPTFYTLRTILEHIEWKLNGIIRTEPPDLLKYKQVKLSIVKNLLPTITTDCKELELSSSLKLVDYIIQYIDLLDARDLKANIVTLEDIISNDLDDRPLLCIPLDRLKWFDKEDIFGEKVSKAFKSAIQDMKDAGNCYAVGLYTACVYYLMRVVEYALRALARERKVILPQGKPLEYATWYRIIKEISEKADDIDKNAIAGPEKDNAMSFYRGLVGEFSAFKDVYRNHVMHTRITYQGYEAERTLIHVKGFMERLSERISEKRTSQISWKLKYNP